LNIFALYRKDTRYNEILIWILNLGNSLCLVKRSFISDKNKRYFLTYTPWSRIEPYLSYIMRLSLHGKCLCIYYVKKL